MTIEERDDSGSRSVPTPSGIKVHKLGHVFLPDVFSSWGVTWYRGGKTLSLPVIIPTSIWAAKCNCGFVLTGEVRENPDDEADYFVMDNRVLHHLRSCTVIDNARIDIRNFIEFE